MTSLYEKCSEEVGSEADDRASEILQCVARGFEEKSNNISDGIDTFFFIYSSSLVFFMQAGFAMLCAGSVRLKNVQNTMLKNLLDACGASLGFYSVGFAFAYGGSGSGEETRFIGNSHFFLIDFDDYRFWLFQFAFAASSATIVAGTLAERCQMTAYLCYSVILTGFVYPIVVHAVWSNSGFLSPFINEPLWGVGVIDFAGSGVVHLTGGLTALIATYILGPRRGRFYDLNGNKLDKPASMPGHSLALQVLGSFILWFGWYGFNAGSALSLTTDFKGEIAALAAVNTTLAAAIGGVTSLFLNLFMVERLTGEYNFNLNFAMNGCLAGLVSITGGCGVLEPWGAVVNGFVAGILYLWVSNALVKARIDDAVDAIPVHLANGIWGLVSVGLMASPEQMEKAYLHSKHVGWFYSWSRGSGDATLLGCQIVGILFIFGWVFCFMFPFFILLNYLGWFRSDPLEEIVGLDLSYHGFSSDGVDKVKSEYLQAYQRRKDVMQHQQNRGTNNNVELVRSKHDEEQHVADLQNFRHSFSSNEHAGDFDSSSLEP